MSRDLELFFKNLREYLGRSTDVTMVILIAMRKTEQDIKREEIAEDIISLQELDAGQS